MELVELEGSTVSWEDAGTGSFQSAACGMSGNFSKRVAIAVIQ